MPDERCGAKTRDGGTCTQWPIAGAKRCRMHGGRTQKAKERVQVQRAMRALGEVPAENVDPAEALLRLVTMKWSEVAWLRQKVREVEDSGTATSGEDRVTDGESLVWGLTKRDEGTGPMGPVDVETREVAPNIWWKLLREAEDQLAKYSTAALRAGVERRQIELQEAHALHLAQAITRILDQLGLSQDQARLVPTVVPAVLRSLPVKEGQ